MPLKTQLNDELKDAMRSGDTTRRTTIRYLLSIIQNEEIAKRSELDDEGILAVLSRQAQQRRDSIEAFEKADRQDLVDKEKAELDYILPYLPQQLSADEIKELVVRAISDVGASGPGDMGKVMSQVMPGVKGRAEGKQVSSIVAGLLKTD
ncbi:MAG: GatB/YqeY domain-containing protein [Chloroflexi bacterium]|nr:GatB/YqeY domain-containing protein [Chloroflexota bacterium]MCH7652293.1 GatB/YqeY domain-containing protein [Chloroflexota bacterium]